MDLVIVYKADGTVQCEAGAAVPLEHHAGELRKLGVSRICGQANVAGPNLMPAVCGAPTGRVNAFAIPQADWAAITAGIAGTLGFRLWQGAPYPALKIDGDCRIAPGIAQGSAPAGRGMPLCAGPVLLREIVGRPGRCYRQGDALTADFVPDRVNVEHDANGRISDVWMG